MTEEIENEEIEETEEPENSEETIRHLLRQSVRFFYDLQKVRVSFGLRKQTKDGTEIVLSEKDQEFLTAQSARLKELERKELSHIRRMMKSFAINDWLLDQKGCGPTMSGVLCSEIDIAKFDTVSKVWQFCGYGVVDGKAVKRTKGQKLPYNPWLKSKMFVLGECLIKANDRWKQFYDNYKTRKQNTLGPCMLCKETGKFKDKTCTNCAGTGCGPWGCSDNHRHMAALRYMVKMFLLEFFTTWRMLEGLHVPAPYSEAYLGMKHGDHAGTSPQPVLH